MSHGYDSKCYDLAIHFLYRAEDTVKTHRCVVCGAMTLDEFFGVALCCPYDDDGNIGKRCKWIYRDRTERSRRTRD